MNIRCWYSKHSPKYYILHAFQIWGVRLILYIVHISHIEAGLLLFLLFFSLCCCLSAAAQAVYAANCAAISLLTFYYYISIYLLACLALACLTAPPPSCPLYCKSAAPCAKPNPVVVEMREIQCDSRPRWIGRHERASEEFLKLLIINIWLRNVWLIWKYFSLLPWKILPSHITFAGHIVSSIGPILLVKLKQSEQRAATRVNE